MTKETEQRDAQLINLKEPMAMTLAKKPANRTGFKIIRSDEDTAEAQPMTAAHHTNKRKRKKKASAKRDDSLYMIRLPEGISREEAESFRDQFAMTDDYDVVQEDSGWFFLKRKNIANWDEIQGSAVDMGNGFVATLDSAVFEGTTTRKDGQHGVKLVELQLDGYDLPAAKAWLDKNEVDFAEGGVEVVDGGVIVSRHEYHKEADSRKVRIGEGVTGVIVRAEDNDVPVHLYRAVLEESYGLYGFGLLDFSQILAAPYYADATWDGIYALREVLESVTLYSGLQLDERMALVDNALNQFGDYYKALIEAMPREVVAGTQRFDDKRKQEATMAKSTEKKVETRTDETPAKGDVAAETVTEEVRTDEVATEATETKVETAAEERTETEESAAPEYVTKDQLGDVVKAAVAEALVAARAEPQTKVEAEVEVEGTEETRTDEGKPSDSDETLAKGIQTLAEATKALVERMDGFDNKLESYGESVEARSDSDSGNAQEEEASSDVFAGMMGSLEGLRV